MNKTLPPQTHSERTKIIARVAKSYTKYSKSMAADSYKTREEKNLLAAFLKAQCTKEGLNYAGMKNMLLIR